MRAAHEPDQDGYQTPRDHDARNPAACTPALHDQRARDFQQYVADKENSCPQAEDAIAESQILRHDQRSISNIYPVQESRDVEQQKEGENAFGNAPPGPLPDAIKLCGRH